MLQPEALCHTVQARLVPVLPPTACKRADVLPGVAGRGDSFATMADLEAGRGGHGNGLGSTAPSAAALGEAGTTAGSAAMVPVQHVRRLTNTLVDILRHVAASGQQQHGLGGDEVGCRKRRRAFAACGAGRVRIPAG